MYLAALAAAFSAALSDMAFNLLYSWPALSRELMDVPVPHAITPGQQPVAVGPPLPGGTEKAAAAVAAERRDVHGWDASTSF